MTVKQAMEQLAAASPTAFVMCPIAAEVWHRLPASVKARARRGPCADCGVEVVWSQTTSPDEPVKVCGPCVQRRVDGRPHGQPIVVLDLRPLAKKAAQ